MTDVERSSRRERLLAAFDAFNDRRIDDFVAVFSPDLVWYPLFGGVEGEVYEGHAGVRAIVDNLESSWDDFRATADEVIELGDRALVLGTFSGVGSGSGIPAAQQGGWLFRFEDDLIVHVRTFGDHEEARRAAGL